MTTTPLFAPPETGLTEGYYQIGEVRYRLILSSRGHLTVRRGVRSHRPVAIVTSDGRLVSRTTSRHVTAELGLLAGDPAAARVAYARQTGRCWRCGRELTDSTSIRLGLGAACAEAVGKETTR